MSEMKKIDGILLHVEDLEASIKFYEDLLGLHRGWTDEENRMIGFVFPGNDTELVIHTDPTIPNPSFNIQVEDVEAYCKHLAEKGYKVLKEPFDVRCGRCASLADPSGNIIDIIDLTKFEGKPRYDE